MRENHSLGFRTMGNVQNPGDSECISEASKELVNQMFYIIVCTHGTHSDRSITYIAVFHVMICVGLCLNTN
jgi:hypothetical protein